MKKEKKNTIKKLKFILTYMEGQKLKFVILMGVVLIFVGLSLLSPILFQFLIDNVIKQDPITNPLMVWYSNVFGGVDLIRKNLWLGALMIITVNLLTLSLQFLRGKWNGQISELFAEKLRNSLFAHLQHMPYAYHQKSKTGDLIQRCTSDVDTVRRFIAGQFSEMLYAISVTIIAMIVLFNVYAPLAWIAIIALPIIFVFAYAFFIRMQKIFKSSDEAEGYLSNTIQENLSGVRVVKAFNREVYEAEKFDEKNKTYKNLTYRLIELLGIYWGASDFICLTQILVVVLFGINYAQQGILTVGQFFIFISYEGMILWPVRNVGRILSDMGKMLVSIGRLQEVLDSPVEPLTEGVTPEIEGDIVFDHVYFKYEDGEQEVLKDVSFSVKKGQTIALLGPTGSGKSSLVHLLTRLYDYQKGSITLNGTELKTIQRHHLRKNIGIVLQEPFLFSKTIFENIRLANPNANERQVIEAAKAASVHRVINEFDMGYKTLVGEKGVTLSGGQKQRIAIARTIINKSPILIFDDSLSAVDTETDAAIRRALKELSGGLTTFIITHRVATAQAADQIVVLQEGGVAQMGTHDELSKQEGLYARIVEIQGRMIEGEAA
ncbi:MAG: ATP-binding cassette subfamily B [Erysipelotrichaceae bacterium]|nr:MAG: ATP-binding cassette subfamily B [Erysipelotrichaceae bacterium]